METWLIYAIASIFCAGIFSFIIKVSSMRNYNSSLLSSYGYGVGAFFAFWYLLYTGNAVFDIPTIALFAFLNVVAYFISTVTRMESMKSIDSVIFFPLYKTFSPIFVTFISIFLFQETLSTKEFIGIMMGVCVPLLLIGTNENTIQKNLKRGVIFVIITSIFVTLSNTIAKGFMLHELNIELFIFLNMFFGTFISMGSYAYFHKHDRHTYNMKGITMIGAILGLFHFLGFMTYQNALYGNLAIVFTLNSFSILIPIILSIIFYKEHFSFKKGFVIMLSILSALMFI